MSEQEVIAKLNEYGISIDDYCTYTNVFFDEGTPMFKTYEDKFIWVEGDPGYYTRIEEGMWRELFTDDLLFFLCSKGLKITKIH